MKNAQQIHSVVSATFPSFKDVTISKDCSSPSNNLDELACSWRSLNIRLKKIGDSEGILNDEPFIAISNVSR